MKSRGFSISSVETIPSSTLDSDQHWAWFFLFWLILEKNTPRYLKKTPRKSTLNLDFGCLSKYGAHGWLPPSDLGCSSFLLVRRDQQHACRSLSTGLGLSMAAVSRHEEETIGSTRGYGSYWFIDTESAFRMHSSLDIYLIKLSDFTSAAVGWLFWYNRETVFSQAHPGEKENSLTLSFSAGDSSIATLRGHSILHTLVRARWSPARTGNRYIYTGCARGDVVGTVVIYWFLFFDTS